MAKKQQKNEDYTIRVTFHVPAKSGYEAVPIVESLIPPALEQYQARRIVYELDSPNRGRAEYEIHVTFYVPAKSGEDAATIVESLIPPALEQFMSRIWVAA